MKPGGETKAGAGRDYATWITAYVRRAAAGYGVRGQCLCAAREMQQAFPELRVVGGKVWLADGTGRCHNWLLTPTGAVLDPTRLQFESEPVRYVPLAEMDPHPTGQCLECWDYRYGKSRYCSPRCERRWRRRPRAERDRLELWVMTQVLAGGACSRG
jgi:hypothetical protein